MKPALADVTVEAGRRAPKARGRLTEADAGLRSKGSRTLGANVPS